MAGEAAEAPQVFINCPYDLAYQPLQDALILSCVACGFAPTSATAAGGGGRVRIGRIIERLRESRYSIHDLSRSSGEGSHPRLNMPLELGMAIYHSLLDGPHDWLALVSAGPTHLQYISDLGGFDPELYDGTLQQLVYKVVGFLAVQDEAYPGVSPRLVWKAMPPFEKEMENARREWGDLPWRVAVEVARRALLPAHYVEG